MLFNIRFDCFELIFNNKASNKANRRSSKRHFKKIEIKFSTTDLTSIILRFTNLLAKKMT